MRFNSAMMDMIIGKVRPKVDPVEVLRSRRVLAHALATELQLMTAEEADQALAGLQSELQDITEFGV